MKKLFSSILLMMVLISLHSCMEPEKKYIQADPPPKDKDQWKTDTKNIQTDPPVKNGGQW